MRKYKQGIFTDILIPKILLYLLNMESCGHLLAARGSIGLDILCNHLDAYLRNFQYHRDIGLII